MKDRDNTHKDAISGGADTPGTADSDGVQGVDDADTREALDSETAALLGSSLRPVAPPAAIRAALLEAVAREPQAGQSVGAADSDDGDAGIPTATPVGPAAQPPAGAPAQLTRRTRPSSPSMRIADAARSGAPV